MKYTNRWFPALLMMTVIFGFSSIPSHEMPKFGALDFSVKKMGHALGYGLLALTYLRGLGGKRPWLAWILAVSYAMTDEFHQFFVPGRGPSVWDVLLFDNIGAIAGLWADHLFRKRKQKGDASAPPH